MNLIEFGEFGELLRSERVRRGLTVDEVASVLKINIRVVRALENADLSALPHAVYAKGFIRSYANLLSLENAITDEACQYLDTTDPEVESTEIHILPRPKKKTKSHGMMWLFLLLILLGAGGWALRAGLFQPLLELSGTVSGLVDKTSQLVNTTIALPKFSEPEPESTEPKPEVVVIDPQTKSEVKTLKPAENKLQDGAKPPEGSKPVETPKVTEIVPEKKTTSEATPVQPNGFDLPTPSPSTTPDTLTLQDGSSSVALPTTSPSQKHQVIISALAECWVHSTADGTDTRQLSIQKGDTFALSFDRKLIIRLGNAGGVRIKYDGKELPVPGKLGQVKTITFPLAE